LNARGKNNVEIKENALFFIENIGRLREFEP
jgi:hypothetical protein